jgi:hypothetical protein
MGLCLKSHNLHLDRVSTARGSGRVDVLRAIFPWTLGIDGFDPTRNRGRY